MLFIKHLFQGPNLNTARVFIEAAKKKHDIVVPREDIATTHPLEDGIVAEFVYRYVCKAYFYIVFFCSFDSGTFSNSERPNRPFFGQTEPKQQD